MLLSDRMAIPFARSCPVPPAWIASVTICVLSANPQVLEPEVPEEEHTPTGQGVPCALTAPHSLPIVDVAVEEIASLLLPQEESSFDCISYFNPVSQGEYERTVDAWADALLMVVNQSTLTLEEAARQ